MVIPSLAIDLLRERAEDDLEFMQYLSRNMGEMAALREKTGEDRAAEELIRAVLGEQTSAIDTLREGIERDRREIHRLERAKGEGPEGV